MKAKLTISNVATINEIPKYWSADDYAYLLKQFDVPISSQLTENEQIEYLQMAVSEMAPNEAAQILLQYKLSEHLNENQIEQISNDMLIDRISEEYPEINLHRELFAINQLLFKLYNGKFLNTKATQLTVNVAIESYDTTLTQAEFLKLLLGMVADNNIIKRLYADELLPNGQFEQANDILWQFENTGNDYSIITSEYWLADQEIIVSELLADFEPTEILESES